MDDSLIYEGAMQVVPLLLIALFLDNRANTPELRSRLGRALTRFQDRAIAVLCLIAFFISMFVLVGAVPVTALTNAIVVAALSGSIGLLFGTIWRRFATTTDDGSAPSSSLSPKDHHDHDS
ncbi:hypothetical protein Bra3105_06290 [Brachybacterium halotolerans subsp. kimchii]|uniref:hypothetical protein n=1 Tax=Brachybacterium halotolerans TaxID=2795215 RepID=UPI001E64D9B2|nr:hypothetical protein [Brachybacterium halotolerans]UEJ83916.1 hypothetical protein Bra3105_06290 [Brachybacterium halotolerans subsp. kimchii]